MSKSIDPSDGASDNEETPSSETGEPTVEDLFVDWGDSDDPEGGTTPPARVPTATVPFSRAKAKLAKQQKERGWVFTLFHTRDPESGLPMSAHVRRVNILDTVTMGHLPKTIQSKLLELQAERARVQARIQEGGANGKIGTDVILRELHRSKEMADAYVLAGFIEPRVYATEADADKHGGAWLQEIDMLDRMSFMGACDGSWEDMNQLMSPFPVESPGDVEDRETVIEVSGKPAFSPVETEDEAPLGKLTRVE